MIKTTESKEVSPHIYGYKAFWLWWLKKNGYNVPFAIFLPAMKLSHELENTDLNELREALSSFELNGLYDVAVRSSCTLEDTEEYSFAGHFLTILKCMPFEQILQCCCEVIDSLKVVFSLQKNKSAKMGIIIQKRVKPQFSGVAFSCDPLSGCKTKVLVSAVKGIGEELVSGRVQSVDFVVSFEKSSSKIVNLPAKQGGFSEESILAIATICKDIEKVANLPVDIEWCIERESGNISVLQCRPITDILLKKNFCIKININNEKQIPKRVLQHDKIQLRLYAQERGIRISKGFLVNADCIVNRNIDIPPTLFNDYEELEKFSLVVLHPERVDGKVYRKFTNRKNIDNDIKRAVKNLCHKFWSLSIIVQHILTPEYTGIIKRNNSNFLIEVSKGHFLPKGMVSPSFYVMNEKGNVLYKSEREQDKIFEIESKGVKTKLLKKVVKLKQESLLDIVNTFKKVLINDTIVEFGITQREEVYLIDCLKTKGGSLSLQDIEYGIISRGKLAGKVAFLDDEAFREASQDFHYHDLTTLKKQNYPVSIFVCKRPYIALLPLLSKFGIQKIGFIFEEMSLLSHFSIVLRENRIPAIYLPDARSKIAEGEVITLDALTSNLLPEERIKFIQRE